VPRLERDVYIVQNQLRATFFADRLIKDEYVGLFEKVAEFINKIGRNLDWGIASDIGVNLETLRSQALKDDQIGRYYCHPMVLQANPVLLRYFRCIAAFSEKGLKDVTGVSAVDNIQKGLRTPSAKQAKELAEAINRNLSVIYGQNKPDDAVVKGIMYATGGASIQGSWNNSIGDEGERVVRVLLLKYLKDRQELSAVVDRTGDTTLIKSSTINDHDLNKIANDARSAIMINGSQLKFGSEPDITVVDHTSTTSAGVEIKAGIDPAGALERHGAAMKSFRSIVEEEPSAATILVMAAITDEVQRRINTDPLIHTTFLLHSVINKESERATFCNQIRNRLGLVNLPN
tara:strand:+ start:132 stop:1169 length:1038 start_codon:yes stop_codon:yes gene_type:complete